MLHVYLVDSGYMRVILAWRIAYAVSNAEKLWEIRDVMVAGV